jgi:hypothetical protein
MPRPNPEFSSQPPSFWAHVRLVSETLGYSYKGTTRRYKRNEILDCLKARKLAYDHLAGGREGNLGDLLEYYLNYRAVLLDDQVRPDLMNRDQARAEFENLRRSLDPKCCLPMNKQKGEKRHHAYLVGIVNMLTESLLGGVNFDDNPKGLVVVTKDGVPLRTLSRWMDGAYPGITTPIAVWEVKEYYGTTTFGSRVADGVYETLLDGLEIRELLEHEGIRILHYLLVDDYYTWWECGRSYLCRIIDMMHMGLVDQVLFGREVLRDWPQIVGSWPRVRAAN